MNTMIEIKLRFPNELMEWKDRKVHTSFSVIPGNCGLWVEKISRQPISEFVSSVGKTYGAVETRWNFKDIDQGHYSFVRQGDYKMFIKLPSGTIFFVNHIVRVVWRDNVLLVSTIESDTAWTLKDDDAKRLYEYLESIAIK